MADTATHRTDAIYRVSNTAIPDWTTEDWPTYTISPTQGERRRLTVSSTGTLIQLLNYTTMTMFCVRNLSTSISVNISYRDGGGNTNVQQIPPGGVMDISSVNPAVSITATGVNGPADCLFAMAGT